MLWLGHSTAGRICEAPQRGCPRSYPLWIYALILQRLHVKNKKRTLVTVPVSQITESRRQSLRPPYPPHATGTRKPRPCATLSPMLP